MTAITIRPTINLNRFIQEAERLFQHRSWITELIQNALRAGSTKITITKQEADLVFTDNGTGISKAGWQAMLSIADTGWDTQTEENQRPAGMGIYAILLRFPTTIESGNLRLSTTPEQIKALQSITLDNTKHIPGTRITIANAWQSLASIITKDDYRGTFRSELFGAAMYNKNGQPVSLEIPEFKITGPIRKQPWALQAHDPQNPQTDEFKVLSFEVHEGTLKMRTITKKIQLPNIHTPDYYVSMMPYEPYNKKSTLLIFHGQAVRLAPQRIHTPNPENPQGQPRSSPIDLFKINILGKSPINLKTPDRTEIIYD